MGRLRSMIAWEGWGTVGLVFVVVLMIGLVVGTVRERWRNRPRPPKPQGFEVPPPRDDES